MICDFAATISTTYNDFTTPAKLLRLISGFFICALKNLKVKKTLYLQGQGTCFSRYSHRPGLDLTSPEPELPITQYCSRSEQVQDSLDFPIVEV